MPLPETNKRYTSNDYFDLPEDIHAELIEGRMYSQAAPSANHQGFLNELNYIIMRYIKENGGKCRVFPAPFAVILDEYTVVEPDVSVICDKNKITSRGCIGAPDFIIEITSSNAGNDYIKKLGIYEKFGVREYWIVNPSSQTIIVYYFEETAEPVKYTFNDIIKVRIYEKLEIDFKEIKKILI